MFIYALECESENRQICGFRSMECPRCGSSIAWLLEKTYAISRFVFRIFDSLNISHFPKKII
jgi:hypothetical protein